MNILILGGAGGIGQALIKHILMMPAKHQIWATYHLTDPIKLCLSSPQLHWVQLDLTKESQIAQLSQSISQVDIIINTVGLLHNTDLALVPEKALSQLNSSHFLTVIQTNALPSILIAKHFEHHLKRSATPRFCTLSAKVGSIEDNHLGGWISYRCSKSALNMAIKTIAIEWQRTIPDACIFVIHPGTTNTSLSEPFQANIPPSQLRTSTETAAAIITQLQRITSKQSGTFIDYNGEVLPW
ncbi:TPA: SDR family NAD(P)-dependent oxidoreductase [Photobacterium damselae]